MNAKLFIKNLNCMKKIEYNKLLLHFWCQELIFYQYLIVLKHIKNKKTAMIKLHCCFERLNLIEFFSPD